MATSDSTDFLVSCNTLAIDAMVEINAIAAGETPAASEKTSVIRALNMMVKNWMAPENPIAPGLKVWQREDKTLTLSSKAQYELKESGGDLDVAIPVEVLEAVLRNTDSEDVPLARMTLEEYYAIGNKSETGTPGRYLYERKLDAGYFTLDFIPSDTTDTVIMTILRVLEDFDAVGNTPDFPQEWYRPLKFNLAIEISPQFSKPVSQDLKDLAQQSLFLANSFAPETSVVYFQPDKDD